MNHGGAKYYWRGAYEVILTKELSQNGHADLNASVPYVIDGYVWRVIATVLNCCHGKKF